MELPSDRHLGERYRLYLLRPGETRATCVATTPTREGIGVALVQLKEDGDLTGDELVGVLDACPGGVEGVAGEWIANPYPSDLTHIVRGNPDARGGDE